MHWHWLSKQTHRVEHFFERSFNQQLNIASRVSMIPQQTQLLEHGAKRALYYGAWAGPSSVSALAAVGGYTLGPIVGEGVAVIGAEGERWVDYWALRENSHISAREARQLARKKAKRTLEYASAAAGVGALAGAVAPASSVFGASTDAGAQAGAAAGSSASAGVGAGGGTTAASAAADAEAGNVAQIYSVPDQFSYSGYNLTEASTSSKFNPAVFPRSGGGFFQSVANLPGNAIDWVANNPWEALGGASGLGLSVAGQLGYLGKTGQQVTSDVQYGLGLANQLGNALNGFGGPGAAGGPPLGGLDAGGGEPPSFADQLGGFLSNLEPLFILLGTFLLLLVLFAGA